MGDFNCVWQRVWNNNSLNLHPSIHYETTTQQDTDQVLVGLIQAGLDGFRQTPDVGRDELGLLQDVSYLLQTLTAHLPVLVHHHRQQLFSDSIAASSYDSIICVCLYTGCLTQCTVGYSGSYQ